MAAGPALLVLVLGFGVAGAGKQKVKQQAFLQNCAARKLCNRPLEERDPAVHAVPEAEAKLAPKGHLKPLGHPDFAESWAGEIDAVESMDPETFWTSYWPKRPFLLKGFAKRSPAFTKWKDDDYLLNNFGDFKAKCESKNEDRLTDYCNQVRFGQKIKCSKDIIPYTELHMKIKKFLPRMKDPSFDKYIVTQMPDVMGDDFVVPNFHSCGKRDRDDPGPEGGGRWMTQMYENNFWISHNAGSNFSTSVIHYDMNHQIMCLFDGVKEWIMWDLSQEAAHIPLWSDLYDAKTHRAQGSDDSPIDGERVDLLRWPQFGRARWMNTTMEAGDCLFTPALLLHYVRSWGRNVAAMTMFQREERYDKSCGRETPGEPKPLSAYDVMWSFPEEDRSLLGWNVVKMGYPNWKRQLLLPLAKMARQGPGGRLTREDFTQHLLRLGKQAGLKGVKKRPPWRSRRPSGEPSLAPGAACPRCCRASRPTSGRSGPLARRCWRPMAWPSTTARSAPAPRTRGRGRPPCSSQWPRVASSLTATMRGQYRRRPRP